MHLYDHIAKDKDISDISNMFKSAFCLHCGGGGDDEKVIITDLINLLWEN